MNEIEIRKALDVLKPNGEIIEVRVIGSSRNRIFSGYFKSVDNLIKAIHPFRDENIYFMLNDINEDCYNREQCEKIIQSPKHTTNDSEIAIRNYILIDIDPKRATGVSASLAEVEKAKAVGNNVYDYLKKQGFTEPVCAFSGNGLHLLYKVSLANNEENTELVRAFLHTLDMLFSNEFADVDTTVYNAGRITKLYGTSSRKGANTTERPHRESKLIRVPSELKVLDKAYIKKVANLYPKAEAKTWQNNYQGNQFDLDSFISQHSISINRKQKFRDGVKYIVDCPFNSNHKGDGAIFKLANGAIGYKCFHNSCCNHDWQSFRDHFEPNRSRQSSFAPNRYAGANKFEKVELKPQEETEDKGKKFLKFSEIKVKDRSEIVSVPTGFTKLDDEIIGLNLGEITLVSGINGSGKSAVIKQLSLNAVNLGYNTSEYSGELDATRSKSWTVSQAAGRLYTEPTRYANYFKVTDRITEYITDWLDGKWWIYNNNYSNNLAQLIIDIEELLDNNDIHIVVVDNIMSLDIDGMGSDKYDNQKQAILALKKLAMKRKVHIIIVAHPRKTMGFLRKEDIAGSGDIINLVENVFIIHRVNNDFLKRFPEFYGEEKASQYYKYGNVLEVAKNRDLGVVDHFVGLYYEIESKRFLNDFTDTPYYGWQDALEQPKQMFIPSEQAFMSESEFTTTEDNLPF